MSDFRLLHVHFLATWVGYNIDFRLGNTVVHRVRQSRVYYSKRKDSNKSPSFPFRSTVSLLYFLILFT